MESKSRIAIIISHPIQHFCPQYASFAKDNEIELKVFFASALGHQKYFDDKFGKEISWNNLRLNEFDHLFLNGQNVLPSDKNIDAPSLNKELTSFNPQLVIIYGYYQKLQRRAYRWAISNNVKLAYISDSELLRKRNRLKGWLKYFLLRKYFSKIDYFLSVGEVNEIFYKYYSVKERKIIRMHFPIDILEYKRSYLEKEILIKNIKDKFGIADNDLIISVVGKLVPSKNQADIINALKLLEEEGFCLTLFIIGSGETLDDLKAIAASLTCSKIIFTGFINSSELPSYYAASDIYVHPSAIDAHPISVSEAIYMGCPVIISDKCGSYGNDDDVQEGRNGYVFECGNIVQLAAKIKILITDENKRKNFSKHAHTIAVEFQEQSHSKVLFSLKEDIGST